MKSASSPLITMIVPAYNAEATLQTALDSLLAQTFSDFEIIVIEDGSHDSTREILQKYEASDARIHVIYKDKNEGLSAGRNSALALAKGLYISFLDADDRAEPDLLETVVKNGIASEADLVVYGYYHDTMDASRTELLVSRTVRMPASVFTTASSCITAAPLCDSAKLFAYSWNKFYRLALIRNHGLCFSSQTLIEDFLFNCAFWEHLQKLTVLDYCGYHYIKASQEALTQRFLPDFFQIMELRYQSIRALMTAHQCFTGEARSQIANVHIKHLLAGMVRDCSEKSGLSFSERKKRAKEILHTPSALEAASYAKGTSRQEKLCNLLFKSRSAFLNTLFASLLHRMQSGSGLFDKLK